MPGTLCCVPECHLRGGHEFPKKNLALKRKWLVAIRRDKWTPSKSSLVCRAHFKPSDYIQRTKDGSTPLVKKLCDEAVPAIFAWTTAPTPEAEARGQRAAKRLRDREPSLQIGETVVDDMMTVAENLTIDEISPAEEMVDIPALEIQMQSSSTQTTEARGFPASRFLFDKDAIHFYSGLESYEKFSFVLATLGPAAYELNYHHNTVLNMSVEDQFFMTLMKLRQNKPNFELSKMFDVSEFTVSNVIVTWINFMYLQWSEVDIFPSRDLVKYYAPSDFKAKFPTTRIIIDGVECPVKKPSAPLAQQATFSTYKNRNTIKNLAGSTPGGLASYVSPSYGGSASDRQIIERTLRNDIHKLQCDPKDSIMADKGFNVQDLFAPYDVAINIPTFFNKKNRMSGKTVSKDRKIASKRVHIERIIGLAKTFKILAQPMSSQMTSLASQITFVCFMLCNFRNCIVPKTA